MAISLVSSLLVDSNTGTMPSHAVGDRIVINAYRLGSNTAPTVPSGEGWTDVGSGSGSSSSIRFAHKKATSTSENIGTFTNATAIVVSVWRTDTPGASVEYDSSNGAVLASTNTARCEECTVTTGAGISNNWVIVTAIASATDTSLETPPTGGGEDMSFLDGYVGTVELALHGAALTSWARHDVSVGGTAGTIRTTTYSIYELAGSGQNLTPSLFTDGDTFYAPTVTPGAVSLAPSLVTDGDTFHAATVSATYSLTAPLFSDGDTFYDPTVTPGAVTLAPDLFADDDTFFGPTIEVAAVDQGFNPSNLDGHVRMYGGFGAYRVRDEDVEALLRVLYRRKKRSKRVERVKELEDAAMAILNAPEAARETVRRVIVDASAPMLAGKARQAELQTLVQAVLQKAADEAALLKAEIDEDEDDVMLLLGAL